VQQGGISVVYDGNGNRVKKTVAGGTTQYLVADVNPTGYAQVSVEEDATGNVQALYVYGLELVSKQQPSSGAPTTYYVYDGHGSVRALTNTSGAVTDTYDYDAFGNLLHSTGTSTNNYLFAGEQYDPDLKLYYNRARYLNTGTGRFISMDSFEGDDDPLSLHKYLYSEGNPIDGADPSGFQDSIAELGTEESMGETLDAMPQLTVSTILQTIPKEETLYVRSFAPWKKFGAYPPICFWNCYSGDDRSFTTSRSVTSRVNGIIQFLLPSMSEISERVYSDPSHDAIGRTATAIPTMKVRSGGGALHMEMAGANPLAPGAPDIDTKLDISVKVWSGVACYTGHLYGDAFPNAEVFVVNSKDQATMLHTFQTSGGRVSGPIYFLPGNNNLDMGSFSSKCVPE